MSRNYDNWERLVAVVIKKQQLWELFHAQSRSPSILSESSDFGSISESSSPYNPCLVSISDFDPVFDLQDLWGASPQILGRGTFGNVYAANTEHKNMSRNYDNWERLVAAVMKKQQLLELFHAHSRTPSDLSEASDISSISASEDVPFSYSISVDKSKNSGLVFISDYRPIVHLEDLLEASFEILGEGTFTSVRAYKLDNGPTIVVKKLKMVNNISEQDFWKYMGMIGAVVHENVAELRAYYYSKDEKLMIYDYYGDGSVSALLHGKLLRNRVNIDWKARLRIAIGAARAISHIHTQNGGKLVHGNIKSSNIFLNSQGYGVVSDLCLATMVQTTFPQSSRCYAPEVKRTRNVSQASDVYSFGVLLLELLTRKSPYPSLGHEAVDLVQLVNSVTRQEWHMKVFDVDLLFAPRIWKEIVRMLEIAISCQAKSPNKRPKMSEVEKMIEDIGMVDIRNHDSIKSESMMNTGTHDSIESESMPNIGTQDSIKAESMPNIGTQDSVKSGSMLNLGNLVSVQTESHSNASNGQISSNHFHSSNTEQKLSRNYHNWERLVAAVLKREELREPFHAHSRRVLSDASGFCSFCAIREGDAAFGSSLSEWKTPLVLISDYRPIVHLEDLSEASFEILGEGTLASVRAYKFDYGTIIVVKRLKMVNISEQDFRKHMRTIGEIKHANVAELRSCYYSKDEKLIICDYYSGGSVSALLHGKPSETRANVDWKVRLRIAIGAARGINHIHAQDGGKLVHGNIKASKIFLNLKGYGIVSDLGLASMVQTTCPQSSRCYAPEVQSTQNVSQASDVYSFGILLLELLTRKSPHPSLGHEAVDLVQLVNSVSSQEWNMNVFDRDLLLTPSIWKQFVRMLEIAISCLAKFPNNRPKMSEVAKMIEEIGMVDIRNHDSIKSEIMMNTGTHDSIESASMINMGNQNSKKSKSMFNLGNLVSIQTERNKLTYVGGGYLAFDLEDLLKASAEFLGSGTFGTSFEVILEEGIIVCVKRLKDVLVTSEEFQQHVEVSGRMGHENVIELKAYYHSRDEKLLVYDYYNHGSLSATLHGPKSSDMRPLDWNTRLKIAISVAKGIAHIHTKNGQKLVHGNIRASNILLNEHQYGIISDVGVGKLVSLPESFVSWNTGYCAPEVRDSKEVSQASDVYSFGIILLELLTREALEMILRRKFMSLVNWIQAFVMDGLTTSLFDAGVQRSGEVDEEMVEMMLIAIDYASFLPERRPKMNDVVKKLEEIQRTERKKITLHRTIIPRLMKP